MINLISKDLRKEEIYIQLADQLEYLERITSESFDKINDKLKIFNNDLIKIEKRRQIIKNKIDQIKTNNTKAIQIFSPFYYPAKNIKDRYKYESIIDNNQLNNKLINKQYSIKQPFDLYHSDDLNEMLNFCDLDTFLKTERESLNFLQRQKLNKSTIPWHKIKSIGSLIIFNSSETAYIRTEQDSSIYEFKTANKIKKNEEDNELNFGNFAPPKSMIKKENLDNFEQSNLFQYDQQEAPKVLDSLPNDLDLDAVADDIFFKEETTFNFSNINNNQIEEETDNKQLPSKLFRIFSSDQLSNSSIEETEKSNKNQINSNVQKQYDSQIPIPPPLPDQTFELSTESDKKQENSSPIKKPIEIDNSRANLLDAIRKAGGKPDKKSTIKEKKLEERKNRKEAVSTDLMSDLKKHLMSRRQAMIGKVESKHSNRQIQRESSVYDTMNKLLPSPSQSSDSDDNSDEGDWVNQ